MLGGCAAEGPERSLPPSWEPAVAERAAAVLAAAIRTRTVNPPGDEAPLAAYYVRLAREAGLEAQVVETPRGSAELGRAAAWARLPGHGSGRALVLLSHLDVVPAPPAEWKGDPFGGAIESGRVIGRGALDAKGVSVVHLLALAELVRRGVRLERDVIFLATPDEEAGGRQGAGYIARERRDLLGDAAHLLTEGGSVTRGTEQSRAEWGVAVTEKSPCWLRLTARGAPGHSAVPPADAAVPRLLAALDRVQRLRFPLRVTPAVARMFAAAAARAAPEDAAGYADLASALATDAAFRERFLASPARRALVADTLAITVLRGGPRTNVLPAQAVAHLDARLLPGGRCPDLVATLREALGDPGIGIDVLLSFPSRTSPLDSPLYRAISRVAARVDPGAVVVPRVTAGFTDAHYFRALGIDAYGFTPRWHYEGELRGIHGVDEQISVENLGRGIETLIALLRELDRED